MTTPITVNLDKTQIVDPVRYRHSLDPDRYSHSLMGGYLPESLTSAIRSLPPDYVASIATTALRIFQRPGSADPSWMAAIVEACRSHGISCGEDGEVCP